MPTATVAPGYQFWYGTSFSSPAAAGAIAYLWRAMPDLTNDQIVTYVENSATDLGTTGRDNYYGYGLVNMQAAYNKLVSDYPMLAKPTISAASVLRSGQKRLVDRFERLQRGLSGLRRRSAAFHADEHDVRASVAVGRPAPDLGAADKHAQLEHEQSRDQDADVGFDPPSVSGFALVGSAVTWSVSENSTYSVQAYVDSASPAAVATNSVDVSGLSAGVHTLHVDATDAAGNSSGWVSYDFQHTVIAPVVPSVVVTDALSATVSWGPVAGAASYDYQVNGGSIQSTTGTSFTIAGLTGGVIPVQVRTVLASSGATSTWTTASVTDNVVVPATPALSAPATVGVPSVVATWPVATYARSYEYRLNGGSSSATTGTSATLSSLALGDNSISVRSLDNLAQSAWATVTVTYTVPVPVVSAVATVWATTATASWSAVAGATSYEFAVNGGSTASTSATSVVVGGLVQGDNAVAVRTVQGANRSAWATVTINYALPSPTTLTLSPSTATVQDPGDIDDALRPDQRACRDVPAAVESGRIGLERHGADTYQHGHAGPPVVYGADQLRVVLPAGL